MQWFVGFFIFIFFKRKWARRNSPFALTETLHANPYVTLSLDFISVGSPGLKFQYQHWFTNLSVLTYILHVLIFYVILTF